VTPLGVVFLSMLVNWWVEKHQRFLYNVYKRFLFLSRFLRFLTFFIFFWNVFLPLWFLWPTDSVTLSLWMTVTDRAVIHYRGKLDIPAGRLEGRRIMKCDATATGLRPCYRATSVPRIYFRATPIRSQLVKSAGCQIEPAIGIWVILV